VTPQENSAKSKIHAAEQSWHKTIGENLLKYAGFILTLSVIVVGLKYGYISALRTANAETGHIIKYDVDRSEKTLLFVSVSSDESYSNEAKVLKEAIASYHGVKILDLQGNYDRRDLQNKNQVVLVLGSQEIDDTNSLYKLMEEVADRNIPLFWLGSGFSQVAHLFDIPISGEEGLSLTPPVTSMTYKGTEITATGLPFTRANLKEFALLGEVLASVKLHGILNRAALIRHGNIIYSAFNPFSQASAPLALPVIMDSLSLLVGEHKPNPRVIFRLEDINGYDYAEGDTSFKKTTDYLIEQGVYVHLGIIPAMVDANGKDVAQIGAALPVLEFIKKNPEHVGIIQHGYKHWRKDPRNKGMGSGDGSEFFVDDDRTMGARAAKEFAKKVIKEGCAVMLENNLSPSMFEAPHYEISPSQQQVAEEMFSLMQHPPLYFYDKGPWGFYFPWLTQRNTTVYVPSISSDYVDVTNPDSLNVILSSLEKVAGILPDPVVLVFFHPFVKEYEGREGDLEKLIQGIKGLNYRFVNMQDEVEALSVLRCN